MKRWRAAQHSIVAARMPSIYLCFKTRWETSTCTMIVQKHVCRYIRPFRSYRESITSDKDNLLKVQKYYLLISQSRRSACLGSSTILQTLDRYLMIYIRS